MNIHTISGKATSLLALILIGAVFYSIGALGPRIGSAQDLKPSRPEPVGTYQLSVTYKPGEKEPDLFLLDTTTKKVYRAVPGHDKLEGMRVWEGFVAPYFGTSK